MGTQQGAFLNDHCHINLLLESTGPLSSQNGTEVVAVERSEVPQAVFY